MPQDLSSLPPGTHQIARTDWALWQKLVLDAESPAEVGYGDYTIFHPVAGEVDGSGVPTACARVKYTTDSEWLLLTSGWRASQAPTGSSEFRNHARDLITRREYAGPDFSAGDRAIKEKAEDDSSGDAQRWLTIGITHHIAFVLHQLDHSL